VEGATPAGLLDIPEQSKPTEDSFDTRPKQVEAWVAALPMANVGESARRIFSALKEINRLSISEHDRFKTMEAFRTPVHHITGVLKKHYISQNLPLSPKNQKIAELAIQLNSEMALGYKTVINDRLGKRFSRLSSKTLTTSIHRAIRYLSNVLLCAYQIYIQHPENVWLQIHRLYLYAEANNLHTTPVKNHVAPGSPLDSSISDIYKQILLLALAGPYRLRQQVIDAVYSELETWAGDCQIHAYGEIENNDYAFTINLNTDAAPGYFKDEGAANPAFCRTVNTSELAQTLSNSLLSSELSSEPSSEPSSGNHAASNGTKIPEDVQKRLLMTWSGKSRRTFSRASKSNEIAITLGLSATHHYIDEIIRPLLSDPATPCPTATESLHTMEPLRIVDTQTGNDEDDDPALDERAHYTSTPVFGISNLDDHTPDVWDPDYTYRVNNPTYAYLHSEELDTGDKASLYAIAPLACKGINESAGGYCLLGYLEYGKNSQKVQVGELVGIRDNIDANSTQLSIGVIRRIKSWKNGLELGLQKLAPCAEAIATASLTDDGTHEKYQRSLVLPELSGINQSATLITHAWHQVDDQLIANVHGHRTLIKLTKQLESTGVFSQFKFEIIDKIKKPNTQPETTESNDEFDSVWKFI
jgi:hypothetical protein